MRLNQTFALTLATTALLFAFSAHAAPVQTFGQNSAVTNVDFSANFDGISDGDSTNYAEGGLRFSAGTGFTGITCQNGGCSYHAGFANMSGNIYYNVGPYAEVKGANNEVFMGFETVVGTGYWTPQLRGIWETWLGDVRTGTGAFDGSAGMVIGLYDAQGFDMVRIGTNNPSTNTVFDSTGATAIDSVRMQLHAIPAGEVPEPGSLALLGLGLASAVFARKRKAGK